MSFRAILTQVIFPLAMASVFSLYPLVTLAGNSPTLNNGQKWRIGYYEGGPYSEYTSIMRTLVQGLVELQWLKKGDMPDIFRETEKPYWSWLSNCNSEFLSFDVGDSYSANWDTQQRSRMKRVLLEKLKAGDLDLVIAMGTWAGQDLANNEHSVPTLVLSTSDPVRAGIIKSAENSGYDHVTARIDPDRYLRQIRMFHRVIGFQTLGLAFEDTPEGRYYSAVYEINQIAKERGFSVVTCEVSDSDADVQEIDRSCTACYRQLAQQVDAVYVTALTCVDRLSTEFADIFKSYGVPSFSMVGSHFVKKGLMLSISSDSGYAQLGGYNAMKFGEMLNGTKARSLQQSFKDPLEIAVNMQTVRAIKFDMPKSILSIASEIYDQD